MALNYEKNNRARQWQDKERKQWSGQVPLSTRKASVKQIGYIQALLTKCGKRQLRDDEVSGMTIAGASRLIENLLKLKPGQ